MYIYQLRQKSSGLFYKTMTLHEQPIFAEEGLLFRDKEKVRYIQWLIAERRKHASYLYHNYKHGDVQKYADEAKLLRPGNFEMVIYFCAEQK